MPTRKRTRRSPALLARAARRGVPVECFEPLEPRVLLSGDAPYETIRWYGQDVEVRAGSWIISFDEAHEDAALKWRTFKAMQGVERDRSIISIEPIGRGQYARVTLGKNLREIDAEHLAISVPGLSAISPDFIYRTAATPNDPLFSQQYFHLNTGQPILGTIGTPGADVRSVGAWDVTTGSDQVIIAVIDTGVDLQHEDLASNIWVNPGEVPGNGLDDDGNGFTDDVSGWDFGELDNDPDDVEGHGTAVAGLIGAVGNNGVGVAGMAWDVAILPMKIADQFGGLSVGAIVAAHDYLTMMINLGHNIVASNNSYAGFNSTFYENAPMGFSAERDAIERFIQAGGTFVASAGNNSFDLDNPNFTAFPASYNIPGLISVAATDNNDALAGFSNFGAKRVDLAAPGVNTLTTSNGGGYEYFGGTSASAPIVAGAVALLKSAYPDASPVQIREALINGADPRPTLQGKMVSGGRLNVLESLRIIAIEGPVVRSVSPGPVSPANASQITVNFSEALDPAHVSLSAVSLLKDGVGPVSLASIALAPGDAAVVITPDSPLTAGTYTLTLTPSGFRDLDGNLLNGNLVSGNPEVYGFLLAGAGSKFETNDTIATATPVAFSATGVATFKALSIGDGAFGALDVDIFRIDMPRGGVITADINAKSLPTPSTLDSYLRLFNADGTELARNDQFDGADSFLDFFVTSGGSYYVGVSGFPNANYDPDLAGSGVTQSKGLYDLVLTIDLVSDDTIFQGASVPAPLAIPDASGSIVSTITVTDSRLVLDVNVNVNLAHDFVSDLRVTLISPAGTEITLMDRRGADGSFQVTPTPPFFPARFDDEAVSSIATAVPPFAGGSFKPDEALAGVDGQIALGTWRLRVEDLAPLNTGALHGWSIELKLQNDIFGPFEFNDTITSARALDEVAGTGAATREAVIGDGGFGFKDVDIFRFTANAGATLNASVASGGTLDSALRLFNAAGDEIKFSNPATEIGSQISKFVFVDAGVYYIAVTEASNVAFDPFAGGSGADAGTTGGYTLSVSVVDGVSDGSITLTGDRLAVGVSSTGTFGAGGVGMRFDGVEFLFNAGNQSPPMAYYGLGVGGNSFRNDGAIGDPDLPMSVVVQSDFSNRRVAVEGVFRGVRVERAISYGAGDSFLVVDVRLTNATAEPFSNVGWMEVLDPSQGLNLVPQSANTSNDVLDGKPFVRASYSTNLYPQGLTIALAAPESDSRAFVTTAPATDTTIRDPQRLMELGVTDPNGATGDSQIALAFNLGVLSPSQTATMRYFVFFGGTPTAVLDLYEALNDGSGRGHLAVDPAMPLPDDDGIVSLPYRVYYPEGYANSRASTFVPIMNPNGQDVRVVVIARYETGTRDQIIADEVIEANTRGGITITTPDLYANDLLLVRKDTPYALEIRSSLPVAATMSHYDFTGSTGEAFTSITSNTWTFPEVSKGQGTFDFIVFQNTSDTAVKVLTTLYRAGGGEPIRLSQVVGAKRRGGWNLSAETAIPNGTYGVVIAATAQLVTAVTSFNGADAGGYGALGTTGTGSVTGALPEGQFGINSSDETISVLNTTTATAQITFTFAFDNAASYRHTFSVGPERRASFTVQSLPGFQAGRPYSVFYESSVPVSVSSPTAAFGDSIGSSFSPKGYTYWGFAEGFRPAGQVVTTVSEFLRVYNPDAEDQLLEIRMRFADGTVETIRQVANARRVTELNLHAFVTGGRTQTDQFYSLTVKSAVPVVAFFGHSDDFFPGAFGLLGTPLGISQNLV